MPQQQRRRVSPTDDNSKSHKRPRTNSMNSRKSSKLAAHQNSGRNPTFSTKLCLSWFHEYTGADEDVIGPEGMEKFCEDIGVEPENIVMLVLAWKLDAKNMGFFTKAEWLKGFSEIQCDNVEKLQAKLCYLRSLLSDSVHFKNIYRFAFDFAREKDQRSMDIETAKSMLQLVLGAHWALYPSFHHFLEQSKYKVINKDQWCNILEFSRTILPDLSNYDEDGAWPVLLDEFVDWIKSQQNQESRDCLENLMM